MAEPVTALLAAAIERHASRRPEEDAVVVGDRRLSWERWAARSRRLATALGGELGIGEGDPVLVGLGTSVERFETLAALGRRGARALRPGDPGAASAPLALLDERRALYRALREGPGPGAVVAVGEKPQRGALSYEALIAVAALDEPHVEAAPDAGGPAPSTLAPPYAERVLVCDPAGDPDAERTAALALLGGATVIALTPGEHPPAGDQ